MEKMSKWMSVLTTIGLSLLLLVLCYFLAGCSVVQPPFEGLPQVASEQGAMRWIDKNITYCSDKEQYQSKEYWASPEETLESRKGDCEDYAILYLAICYESLGKKGKLMAFTNVEATKAHALGDVDGKRYTEALGFQTFYFSYEYDDVLLMLGDREQYIRGGANDNSKLHTDTFYALE